MPVKINDVKFQKIEEHEGEEYRETRGLDFLDDVYLPVSIELGRSRMQVRDILNMERGALIEFDKLAGETVDLMVNDRKFAEGEVVVIDERFGIRITGLYKTADILKEVRK
jgi:flagellar motor switch protein FliN/FliY